MTLVYAGISGLLLNASGTLGWLQQLTASAGGAFLLVGLWTPVIGVIVALGEASTAFMASADSRDAIWAHSFVAVLALSMAMLGPGAWSIDARLFGRKRFDITRSGPQKPAD